VGPAPTSIEVVRHHRTDVAYDGDTDGRMISSRFLFLDGMSIAQAKEEVAKRLEGDLRGNMPLPTS